ncbi:MAG: ABC transporter permease subunit, partial [Acidimicrobiales bacterium]
MGHFISFAIPGIPYGCDFAIVAIGLILTYRATGVFNFAFGAQAYMSAYVFDVLVKNGAGEWWSFFLAVVVMAPALGLAFNRFLFRHIATQAVTAKVVTSLGLFVALPNIVTIVFSNKPRLAPPSLVLSPDVVYFHLGSTPVNGNELATVIVTVASAAILAVLIRATSLGLQMRATVESRRMARLEGVNSEAVVSLAWAVSSLLAGLAGVLLAPLYATLNSNDFTILTVTAIMIAAIGGLRSMPWALAGGVAFGALESVLSGYLPSGSILATGVEPALPFLILVLLLLFHPGLRHLDDVNDPLVSVDPPLPPPAATLRAPQLDGVVRVGGRVLAVAFVVSCLTWVPDHWVFTLSQGIALSAIFLSITLLTGLGGQLSLAQATFAGIGAFTAGQLALHFGLSVLAGMVIGAVVAALVGSLAALPALRLQGLALALLTLALALLADSVVFPQSWVSRSAGGLTIPRPVIGSINF